MSCLKLESLTVQFSKIAAMKPQADYVLHRVPGSFYDAPSIPEESNAAMTEGKNPNEVAGNVMTHGGVVAGNFAYLALLSIFPFFIVAAALGGVFGRSEYGAEAVQGFLAAVPPSVASCSSLACRRLSQI